VQLVQLDSALSILDPLLPGRDHRPLPGEPVKATWQPSTPAELTVGLCRPKAAVLLRGRENFLKGGHSVGPARGQIGRRDGLEHDAGRRVHDLKTEHHLHSVAVIAQILYVDYGAAGVTSKW